MLKTRTEERAGSKEQRAQGAESREQRAQGAGRTRSREHMEQRAGSTRSRENKEQGARSRAISKSIGSEHFDAFRGMASTTNL